jgi:hypothetical protein
MSEHNFNRGELIVPNDDIRAAFLYDPFNTELIETIEYRIATSAEFIWWNKNRHLEPMNGGVESYKKARSNDVGNVYKSIDKEKSNQKKHGLS